MRAKSVEELANLHNVSQKKIEGQIKIGLEVEKEHTSDKKKRDIIARQHLAELPDYYDRLDDMESKAKKVNEIQDFKRGMDPKRSLGIGLFEKTLNIVKSEWFWGHGIKHEITPDDKILLKGIKHGFGAQEFLGEERTWPEGTTDFLASKSKFDIGSIRFGKLSYLLNEAIDEGYLPQPSKIKNELWQYWSKDPYTTPVKNYTPLTDDNLIKMLKGVFGDFIPSRILIQLRKEEEGWNRIISALKSNFLNNELRIDIKLKDLPKEELVKMAKKTRKTFDFDSLKGVYDVTSLRQERAGHISLEDDIDGNYIITKSGRISGKRNSINIYNYPYTDYNTMAAYLIKLKGWKN